MSNWFPMRPVRNTKVVFYDQFGLPIVSSGSPMPKCKPPKEPENIIIKHDGIINKILCWMFK